MIDLSCRLYDRIEPDDPGDPVTGSVRWSPLKSLWLSGMFAGWVILGSLFFTWSAVLVFLGACAITLCLGHSLGMHRKLIHEGFDCPDWMEKLFVYLGTLVGMGGPFTMMFTHDVRDWAQRQPRCHDFLAHQRGILLDGWWQLHCKLHLDRPPAYRFPDKLTGSRFYRLLQDTSMFQQVPVGVALLAAGGWGSVGLGWAAWGVCGRVSISIFGHWLVGYIAHNRGHRDWHVEDAAVQGHNVRFCGLITFGECWHNNHHAFPGSAKLGLYPGQFDPGWIVLTVLEGVGLVSALKQPHHLPARPELLSLGHDRTDPILPSLPAAWANNRGNGHRPGARRLGAA